VGSALILQIALLVVLGNRPVAGQTPPSGAQSSSFTNHSRLGHLYEARHEWDAAQAAYAKALEAAGAHERAAAEADLQRVLEKKDTLWDGHIAPFARHVADSAETALTAAVSTAVIGVVLVLLWVAVRLIGSRIGTYRGRNKLLIGDFVNATRVDAGNVFADVMRNAIERVQEYYRPRDRFRFGAVSSMILVVSPEPAPMAELISAVVSAESGKVWTIVWRSFFKPQYRIDGTFQCVQRRYHVWLRLRDPGGIVATWDRQYDARDFGGGQEQLAFEIAMFLKDQVRTDGN
jgi:hypothetical protein